jgi:hypothetical protein
MKTEDFKTLSPGELRVKLINKQKAADNLSVWLSRHDKREREYARVMDDRKELAAEIQTIEKLIAEKQTPVILAKDISFELCFKNNLNNKKSNMTTLKNLSPEEKELLKAEIKAEEKTKKSERVQYKELASDEVIKHTQSLVELVNRMRDLKIDIFKSFQTLVASKGEVFDLKDTQKTHTFTSLDGKFRIIMGVRDISSWDGTEDAGVQKVKEYLGTLAKDAASGKLVKMIEAMLKPDKKGNLDPRRIIELSKIAEDAGDDNFTDGINIIMRAYSVVSSQVFLECMVRDEHNKWNNINKNFSEINVDEKLMVSSS